MGFFYPGSLWQKRITRFLILCAIGVNLFVNDLQNALLDTGQQMVALSQKIADPAVGMAYAMEYSLIPTVNYIEESNLSWLVEKFGVPSSQTMQQHVDNAYQMQESLEQYGPVYEKLSYILKGISAIFWIPIILSGIWVIIDIQEGSTQIFNVVAVVIAVIFNIWSYNILHTLFFS